MTIQRLPSSALAFLMDQTIELRPTAFDTGQVGLSEPFMFLPSNVSPHDLPNLEWGGVTTQDASDGELAKFIVDQSARSPGTVAVLYDPAARPGDLDHTSRDLPEFLVQTSGVGNAIVIPGRLLTVETVRDFRSVCVSFLKFIFVTDGQVAPHRPIPQLHESSARLLIVSCLDDESWMGAKVSGIGA